MDYQAVQLCQKAKECQHFVFFPQKWQVDSVEDKSYDQHEDHMLSF
jgi:hypothetical protein